MSGIFQAFHQIVANPIAPIAAYVVLWRNEPFYGGPQEGGWWGNDRFVEAYTRVSTREEADALAEQIKALARELTAQAARDHGRGCRAQLDWCEARGIEDSNSVFGEDSGPSTYFVTVEDEAPRHQRGEREWS